MKELIGIVVIYTIFGAAWLLNQLSGTKFGRPLLVIICLLIVGLLALITLT